MCVCVYFNIFIFFNYLMCSLTTNFTHVHDTSCSLSLSFFLSCSHLLVTLTLTFIQDLFLHSYQDRLCDHRFGNISIGRAWWAHCWVYSWRQWPLPQILSVSKTLAEKEEWGSINLSSIHDWRLTNLVSYRQMQTTLAVVRSCLHWHGMQWV